MSQDVSCQHSVHLFECSPTCLPPGSVSSWWAAARCPLYRHPASPGHSPGPAGGSGPGSHDITALALGPGACEILCVPFKSEVSLSPSPVGFLQLSPAGLQFQMLWGLVFLVPDLWARGAGEGCWHVAQDSLLWENLCSLINLQSVGHPPSGSRGLIILWVCPSYLSSCGSFFISLAVEHLSW